MRRSTLPSCWTWRLRWQKRRRHGRQSSSVVLPLIPPQNHHTNCQLISRRQGSVGSPFTAHAAQHLSLQQFWASQGEWIHKVCADETHPTRCCSWLRLNCSFSVSRIGAINGHPDLSRTHQHRQHQHRLLSVTRRWVNFQPQASSAPKARRGVCCPYILSTMQPVCVTALGRSCRCGTCFGRACRPMSTQIGYF